MRSSTTTLISALRILARDIKSDDGVANAAIAEAADRLEELSRENARLQMELNASREDAEFRHEQNRQLRNDLFGIKRRIIETVTNDKMNDRGKVLDIQFVLRKEAQP